MATTAACSVHKSNAYYTKETTYINYDALKDREIQCLHSSYDSAVQVRRTLLINWFYFPISSDHYWLGNSGSRKMRRNGSRVSGLICYVWETWNNACIEEQKIIDCKAQTLSQNFLLWVFQFSLVRCAHIKAVLSNQLLNFWPTDLSSLESVFIFLVSSRHWMIHFFKSLL